MASWHAALDAPPAPRPQAFDPPAPRHRRSSRPRRGLRRSSLPRRGHQAFEPPAPRSSRSRRRRGSIVRAPRSASTTTSRRRRRSSRSRSTPGKTNRRCTTARKTEDLPPAPVAGRSVPPIHDITDLLGPEPLPEVDAAPTIRVAAPPGRSSIPTRRSPRPRHFTDEAAGCRQPPPRRSRSSLIAVAAVVLVLAGGGRGAIQVVRHDRAGAPPMGALVVQSNPAGVPVFVDGVEHGKTPARVTLAARVAHPRAARPRRAARDSAHHHARRGSLAVPGVRRSAGQRAARRAVRAGRREGAGRRRRARRGAADRARPRARRSSGGAAEQRRQRAPHRHRARREARRRCVIPIGARRDRAGRCPAGSR